MGIKYGYTIHGFTGGILSPEIHGRSDFDKVRFGLADAKNFNCKPTGMASFRVGTKMVAPCKYPDKKVSLIKFGADRDNVYTIEAGDGYFRFFRNGGFVAEELAVTNGTFDTDIAGWTTSGTVYWDAGEMVISGASSSAEQSFTVEVDQDYTFSLDVSGADLRAYVGTTSGASDIGDFFLLDGGRRSFEFKAPATTVYVTIISVDGGDGRIDNVSAIYPYEVATPYLEDQVASLKYTQDRLEMFITHPKHPPKKLARAEDSETDWTLTDMVFNPDSSNVSGITLTKDGTTTVAFDWGYTVSTVFKDGTESKPFAMSVISADIELQDSPVTISFNVTAENDNVKHYKIYRQGGGYPYLINIINATGLTTYTTKDNGLTADESMSPVEEFDYFNGEGKYPIACGMYNQRLVLGGTEEKPDTLWFSWVRQFENFTNTPLFNDNEAFERRLNSGSVNRIKHLQALDDLLCLTDGKLWRIQGTSNSDILAYVESSIGSGDARPYPSRKSLLFVESNENTVSDFIYKDSVNGFDGDKLDILARSLFRGKEISSISFQDSPDGMLFATMSDGSMNALTYLKNQDVYAWTYYETHGDFEGVMSIDKNIIDDTYIVGKRTIGGETKRFIELFMHEFEDSDDEADDWHLDCGLRYDGNPTSKVAGLNHLIGETVTVYADGNDLEEYTVDSDGCVTLGKSYSKILVGLSYEGLIETIPAEVEWRQVGTTIGVKRSVSKVAVSLYRSRGFFYSGDGKNFTEHKTMKPETIGDVKKSTGTVVFDVESDSTEKAPLYIKQSRPLSLNILNITQGINFGDR